MKYLQGVSKSLGKYILCLFKTYFELQVQSVTNDIVSLKQEIVHLKEDLKEETTRRQMAEESCQQLIAEKGK